ncbi:hypothetical protein [Streptomyces scabiei]|uniref:hypothetical protein n=1 Tax=Streptomyces scabiei TaxID=1930 RepID=UPI000766057B|nr:hypothetical protein [Streptomyces scabiei]
MKPTLLEAAASAGRAAEAHITSGCTTCHRGARLAELCPDGQRAVTDAANAVARGLLDGPCAHTSWEVTSERRTPDGWVKSRKCSDCGDPLNQVTEPEPHWPENPSTLHIPAPAVRTDPAPPGPARLAALMASRQHWRNGRLVSEGTVSQDEIRDALGWGAAEQVHGITWEPGQMDQAREAVRILQAGRSAFPGMTDAWVVRTARTLLPDFLALVELLHARVMDLEAHGCRCYDPTSHAPGCVKAFVRWQGRTYPAAVWYRDRDGDWWAPESVDTRGCLVLLLDGDSSNEPVPLDRVNTEHGSVTATAYGAHVPRGDLPEAAGTDAARRAVDAHMAECWNCDPKQQAPRLCPIGQELTRAAAT